MELFWSIYTHKCCTGKRRKEREKEKEKENSDDPK
jgi:hypothetical protein